MKRASIHPLHSEQRLAVEPRDHIWLSASAGTGKTQVLTARVFRLLLEKDVRPENILCLTFTKAGAAEMADRVHSQLAKWVQLKDDELGIDLRAIGAKADEETRERARTLFAQVLDAPGGGLPIMTIHSFSQTLLASFPSEASMIPGFKPLEDRDQKILARETLANLLVSTEREGDSQFMSNVQLLSRRYGEDGAVEFMMRCARAPEEMQALPTPIHPIISALMGLKVQGDVDEYVATACSDENVDLAGLRSIANMLSDWGTKGALAKCDTIAEWLGFTIEKRAEHIGALHSIWAKADGEPRSFAKGQAPQNDEYEPAAMRMFDWAGSLIEQKRLAEFVDLYSKALDAGRAFSAAYSEAKRMAAVVDFDDLIRKASALLQESNMAEWIRYKLDRHIDHILVDEAQDTNQRQWNIVQALTSDFFSGSGAQEDKVRTLFTVGDFKQAIFGFQGTSPENYKLAGQYFSDLAVQADQEVVSQSLSKNFRSTPPVLAVVDAMMAKQGHESFGLSAAEEGHVSHHRAPGCVKLLKPVLPLEAEDVEGDEEQWLGQSKRGLAQKLAIQVKQWLDKPLWLESKNRALEPGDIMILVRKRDELASLIVARLFAEDVPVAGMDRLNLKQPLAVQDLLAAVRFVLQPDDDLNLASLLVSPLLGWTQEDLLEHGYRGEKKVRLWEHLRRNKNCEHLIAPLFELLGKADFSTPYKFLEEILSGPLQGRMKLVSRLTHSALDPIEELLSAALSFERDHVATLQTFINWLDRGDVEIKRDAINGGNQVRVMTVHGSKGLQAPMVILADATADPSSKADRGISWNISEQVKIPVVPLRKSEKAGPLKEAAEESDQRELEEHWRLLYVAMTRAEEHLVIAGALGPRAKGKVPELSWYQAIDDTMNEIGCDWLESQVWNAERVFNGFEKYDPAKTKSDKQLPAAPIEDMPSWAKMVAPAEANPPRPLTPSHLHDDDVQDPPPTKTLKDAAKRGQILHSLFERLPSVPVDDRREAANNWLKSQHHMSEASQRDGIVTAAINVIEDSQWSDVFGPESYAEIPLAAIVGDKVISGSVDRLLVRDQDVYIIDFKTGRYPPKSIEKIPVAYLRQMSAYVAAVEVIFPSHKVHAALLYTHSAAIFHLSDAILDQHKPSFQGAD